MFLHFPQATLKYLEVWPLEDACLPGATLKHFMALEAGV